MRAYQSGERLGPDQILLIERLKTKDGKNSKKGRFECPLCHRQDWITDVSPIAQGITRRCQQCLGIDYSIIGKKYGRLTVLGVSEKRTNQNTMLWKCQCSCDNKTIVHVRRSSLENGDTQSCGCLHKEVTAKLSTIDLLGQRFGHLTVIGKTDIRKGKEVIWKCQCDCPNKTIVEVRGYSLRSGHTQSCGCSRISRGEELIIDILSQNNIKFEYQKSFSDCINPKTNRHLHFDFYLDEYNLCIEFDGQQHFYPISLFGGEEGLK